jgi:hypothetical protein
VTNDVYFSNELISHKTALVKVEYNTILLITVFKFPLTKTHFAAGAGISKLKSNLHFLKFMQLGGIKISVGPTTEVVERFTELEPCGLSCLMIVVL